LSKLLKENFLKNLLKEYTNFFKNNKNNYNSFVKSTFFVMPRFITIKINNF